MSDDNIALSEEIKAQANQKFVEKKWHDAHDLYTKAIELNPNNSILYANRSATQLNLEAYGAAVLDATKAIETDPKYVKGYYRRGCAYVARGKYQEALQDFHEVCKLSPKDKLALNRYNECYKAMRREAFEKAIECENGKPPSETIDLSKYEIERGYEGIHVPENLSLEWILELKDFYKDQKKLHIKYIFQILLKVKEILSQTPSLVEVKVPENGKVVVYGDVHGQYYDLLNALTLSDLPSPTNILIFNGDLVDRGSWSVEVIMLILAMKATFPDYVHISRGNHETKSMNKVYGFEGEVRAKYTELCFDLFLEVFNYLPLAHVIDNKVFICHGGLFSDDNVTLQDIKNINRVREPPDSGLMCELLWSDPLPDPLLGRQPSKRGVGIGFGRDVTENFLRTNGLELVVRSHEVRDNGYSVEHDGKLITIFSAPNYCDQGGNKGAIIKFEKDLKPQFVTFSHVPHPPMKPMAYSSMSNYM